MHHTSKRFARPALVVALIAVAIPTLAKGQPTQQAGASAGDPARVRTATSRSSSLSGLFDLSMPAAPIERSYWDGGERARRRWEARRLAAITAPVATLAKSPAAATPGPAPTPPSGTADWAAIAWCESSGRWDLNSGNGFWGGLQFTPNTWFAYGGGPFDGVGPFPYSQTEQIAVGQNVLDGQGPSAWPNCFAWA